MKEIKILHMFPKLLSLYGEYGNISVLRKTLEDHGCVVTVNTFEDGEPDLDCDLIYVGAGTEDNLLEGIRRLLPYRQKILASVNAGTRWLATGNAMTLFGATVTRWGKTTDALGCFDYTTVIHDDKRYLGDVVTEDALGGPMIGFVNTSSVYQGIRAPLLTLQLNPKLGNTKQDAADGICAGNFRGTQLIGPVLAKNPHFLAHICQELTGEEIAIPMDSNMQKAYEVSLSELTHRMQ